MEPRLGCLVRDLYLSADRNDRIKCLLLGGPRINAGDNTQGPAAIDEVPQLLADQPETGKSDKGTQQVDPVGAL